MIFNIEVHKHFVDYRLAVTDNRAVYCIHDPSSKLTKIGFSTNAQRRLQEVKYGSRDFRKAYLLGAIYTGYYRQVEKDLHHVYSEKRVKGEWFSLSLDETKWIFDTFKPHREFVAGSILLYNRKHKWVCCPSNGVVFLAYSFWNTYIQGDATEFYRFGTRNQHMDLAPLWALEFAHMKPWYSTACVMDPFMASYHP